MKRPRTPSSSIDSDSASDPEDILALQGGLGGGGGRRGSARLSGGRRGRGAVWERSTASTGSALPLWTAGSGLGIFASAPLDHSHLPTEPPVVESYLGLPTPLPSVNYKHLYIVHRLVTRRMRNEPPSVISDSSPMPHKAPSPSIVKPRVLDAVSSMLSGGLPGHTEAIYSLELFRQRMTIHSLTPLRRRPHQPAVGWAPPEDATEELTFSGRDWLLSGSRDRTLRLWQLSTVEPRVAKVFHDGHEGSILSHYIARIPMGVKEDVADSPSGSPRSGTPSADKVVAVSGGSDGRICLWAIEDGIETPAKVNKVYSDPVLCVKGDDRRVVSCSKGASRELQTTHYADLYPQTELSECSTYIPSSRS